MEVIYTAAHSGFDSGRVPLGGGAAVCAHLTQEWEKTRPFSCIILGPSLLGRRAPQGQDPVEFSEWRYARFCRQFEAAATEQILHHDPSQTIVLSNDVSEGPNFRLLAKKGYPLYTIYHVDVVDYFFRIYLHHHIRPAVATRLYERLQDTPLPQILPSIVKLLFQKQRDSVFYSRGLIVPSDEMKRMFLECYPSLPPEKTHVIPWGIWEESFDEAAVQRQAERLRREHGIPSAARVLLTLSRISPEKGQDRLLEALSEWEKGSDFPAEGLWVFICGEAAYMQGRRFLKRLQKLARRLQRTHVVFPGYAAGTMKHAYFRLADLYVFPSRHESYGLTLLEALRAGLPALACHHYGAQETLQPAFGEVLPDADEKKIPGLLREALQRLLHNPARLKAMGKEAQRFAATQRFSDAAARLASLLRV